MIRFRSIAKILVLAALAVSAYSQGTTGGLLYASDFANWSLPQGNTPMRGTVFYPNPDICKVTSNGYTFLGAKVGRPLTIVDGANTETFTPTAVSITTGTCMISGVMAHSHSTYSIKSGTAGAQEAIDYQASQPQGANIVLTPMWTAAGGSTGLVTGTLKGNAGVTILDQRTSAITSYTWNGSAYVANPFAVIAGGSVPGDCAQIGTGNAIAGTGAPCGGGMVSGQANGFIPLATSATGITAQSHLSDTAGAITSTEPINTSATSNVNVGTQTIPSGFKSGIAAWPAYYNPNVGIDVIAAGAVGDCVTDDHDAITRAMTAAMANVSAPALPLKFPRPPGGCYLSSTLLWHGLSMFGETAGPAANVPVQLNSKAGQDLWNFPDPSDTSTTVASKSPRVQHMKWVVDDTVDASASHPHRKPGRTVTDGVTTSATDTVTSAKIICSGGDVGQGLLITYPDTTTQSMVVTSCSSSANRTIGTGMGGVLGNTMTVATVTPAATTDATLSALANTVTVASATGIAIGQVAVIPTFPTNVKVTVTNVVGTTVTLSTNSLCIHKVACALFPVSARFYSAATTLTETQTGVTFYLSAMGIPVTETIGNCALAIDGRDGTQTAVNILLNGAHFEDLAIAALHSPQNKSCGIYLQGVVGLPYASIFHNIRMNNLVYGFFYGMGDTNPLSGSASQGGDFDVFNGMNIGATHPLTIYNGENGQIQQIQTSGGSNTGVQMLAAWSATYSGPLAWLISVPEQEQGAGTESLRLEGRDHYVVNTSNSSGGTFTWAAHSSTCMSCVIRQGSGTTATRIHMLGIQNDFHIRDGANSAAVSDDPANGNRVIGMRQNSATQQFLRPLSINRTRNCLANDRTGDFTLDSPNAPYLSRCDLWWWPQEVHLRGGTIPAFVYDPTSETGYYEKITTNEIVDGTTAWPSAVFSIGLNIPAGINTFWTRAKCPSITSYTIDPSVYDVATDTLQHDFGAQTVSCSAGYTSQSFTIDLTPYGGNVNYLRLTYSGVAGNEVDRAWSSVRPQLSADRMTTNGSPNQGWGMVSPGVQGWINPGVGLNTAVPPFLQYYGDGSDGALNVASGTTTITGPKYYTTVNVAAGANLVCVRATPCIIYATTSITNAGLIAASAVLGTANAGSSGAGNNGGAGGGSGGGAAAGTAGAVGWYTGGGGTAGAITGGNGADATSGVSSANTFGDARKIILSGIPMSSNFVNGGLQACGGGGVQGGSTGGAPGLAGCTLALVAPIVTLTGTEDVTGTNGTSAAANSTGAGSAGGGGELLIRSPALTDSSTKNLTGGMGGGCTNPAIVLTTPTTAGLNLVQTATTQAQAHVSAFSGGNPTTVTVDRAGAGYTFTPNCTVVGTGGGGNTGASATCTATVAGGVVTGITVSGGNAGYGTGTTYTTCGYGGSGWQGWSWIFSL